MVQKNAEKAEKAEKVEKAEKAEKAIVNKLQIILWAYTVTKLLTNTYILGTIPFFNIILYKMYNPRALNEAK